MTQEHPITPPPELVQEWVTDFAPKGMMTIATQAARWGADQELEACCEWLKAKEWIHHEFSDELRATRRPKPPGLKEQALAQVESFACSMETLGMDSDLIRRALEQLND